PVGQSALFWRGWSWSRWKVPKRQTSCCWRAAIWRWATIWGTIRPVWGRPSPATCHSSASIPIAGASTRRASPSAAAVSRPGTKRPEDGCAGWASPIPRSMPSPGVCSDQVGCSPLATGSSTTSPGPLRRVSRRHWCEPGLTRGATMRSPRVFLNKRDAAQTGCCQLFAGDGRRSPMPPSPKDSLQELRIISAQLGRNPELVQGAGGNTSIKSDGLLWIKGSGRWLADAEKADCFVPLELQPLLEAVQNGHEDPASFALCRELCPPGLRPSVETSLHAVMPQACVLHVHSVSAIAWGVHPQGRVLLSERLKGLPWHWIPYVRPGLPLTAEVSRALERAPADVLVLANHGLVVAGESPREALELLREVESRINIAPRPFPVADIERL